MYVDINQFLNPILGQQIYNLFTLSVMFSMTTILSTNVQTSQKKSVDSTLNIRSNLQSTFTK